MFELCVGLVEILMEEENTLKRKAVVDEFTVLSASSALSLEENKRLEDLWMNNHKNSTRKVEVQDQNESGGKLPKKRVALLLSYAGTGYHGMQL